jgi:hypothetical protein
MMGILALIGALVFLIGWIWMIVVAFKEGGALWAVLVFFFSWIAGLIFAVMKKIGWTQVGIMILGLVLIVIGNMMGGGLAPRY